MAILEDSSTPAVRQSTTGADLTTASFSPPAGTLVVAMAQGGWSSSSTDSVVITDSSGGGTWTGVYQSMTSGFFGCAAIAWKWFSSAPGSITVNANFTGLNSDSTSQLVVKVLTGVDPVDPIGSSSGRNRGNGGSVFEDVTPHDANSLIYVSCNLNDTNTSFPSLQANTADVSYHVSISNVNACWAYMYDGYTPSTATINDIGGTLSDTSAGSIVHVEVRESDGVQESHNASDPLGLTDSVTTELDAVRNLSEDLGLTDDAQTVLDAQRDFSESIGLTDEVATALDFSRSYDESLALTDEVTVSLGYVRDFSEDMSLTDASEFEIGLIVNVSDSIGLTDDTATVHDAVRDFSEDVALTENFDAVSALTHSESDTLSLSDDFSYVLVQEDITDDIGQFATTLVMGPATVYVGDFGAPEPEGLDILNEPSSAHWTDIGGSLGGVEMTVSQEYETVELLQSPDESIRRLKRRRLTAKTVLAEPTLQRALYALNSGTLASGSGYQSYTPPAIDEATELDYRAVLIYGWAPGLNGNQHKRRVVILRKCLSIDNVEMAYHKEDQTAVNITWAVHWVDANTTTFKVIDEA